MPLCQLSSDARIHGVGVYECARTPSSGRVSIRHILLNCIHTPASLEAPALKTGSDRITYHIRMLVDKTAKCNDPLHGGRLVMAFILDLYWPVRGLERGVTTCT